MIFYKETSVRNCYIYILRISETEFITSINKLVKVVASPVRRFASTGRGIRRGGGGNIPPTAPRGGKENVSRRRKSRGLVEERGARGDRRRNGWGKGWPTWPPTLIKQRLRPFGGLHAARPGGTRRFSSVNNTISHISYPTLSATLLSLLLFVSLTLSLLTFHVTSSSSVVSSRRPFPTHPSPPPRPSPLLTH